MLHYHELKSGIFVLLLVIGISYTWIIYQAIFGMLWGILIGKTMMLISYATFE